MNEDAVTLWGQSKGSARSAFALSVSNMLYLHGEIGLRSVGNFASAMLIFKRCIAVLRAASISIRGQSDMSTKASATKACVTDFQQTESKENPLAPPSPAAKS